MEEKRRKKMMHPASVIAASFLLMIAAGTALLMLPFMTRDGRGLSFVQALFTATSGVCVTGLTLIDPMLTLSRYGQVLLLMLIEAGGISMVTFATFFIFAFKKRSALRSLRLAQEYTNVDVFSQVKPLVRTIIATAVLIQLLGAAVLCIRFVPRFGAKGVWTAVFTAVSSYCNAGFDLFGTPQQPYASLSAFNGDPLVMVTVMLLIVTGGLGFFVFYDLLHLRRGGHLSLHTRVVLVFTAALIAVGAVLVLTFEFGNRATLGALSGPERVMAAFFQSVTTRTAGFASVDIAALRDVTKLCMIALMFIGAGSGSTGGGIKITTFAVLIMTVMSVLRGKSETVIFGRRVDARVVAKALAVAMLGILIVLAGTIILVLERPGFDGVDALFEAVSAFATTGLSSGVTAGTGVVGKIALVCMMYIGRVGPVCFIIALNRGDDEKRGEVLPEGRIMVG
ncbi:MAG: hypothetical protein IKN72_08055 [Clostridia bacterium]|nr:hypothetical protein [Clostridia bacterium]MBR3553326.1 hypothetical protein [Clostridia bacterium]